MYTDHKENNMARLTSFVSEIELCRHLRDPRRRGLRADEWLRELRQFSADIGQAVRRVPGRICDRQALNCQKKSARADADASCADSASDASSRRCRLLLPSDIHGPPFFKLWG